MKHSRYRYVGKIPSFSPTKHLKNFIYALAYIYLSVEKFVEVLERKKSKVRE